jgi:hypothetical protein
MITIELSWWLLTLLWMVCLLKRRIARLVEENLRLRLFHAWRQISTLKGFPIELAVDLLALQVRIVFTLTVPVLGDTSLNELTVGSTLLILSDWLAIVCLHRVSWHIERIYDAFDVVFVWCPTANEVLPCAAQVLLLSLLGTGALLLAISYHHLSEVFLHFQQLLLVLLLTAQLHCLQGLELLQLLLLLEGLFNQKLLLNLHHVWSALVLWVCYPALLTGTLAWLRVLVSAAKAPSTSSTCRPSVV